MIQLVLKESWFDLIIIWSTKSSWVVCVWWPMNTPTTLMKWCRKRQICAEISPWTERSAVLKPSYQLLITSVRSLLLAARGAEIRCWCFCLTTAAKPTESSEIFNLIAWRERQNSPHPADYSLQITNLMTRWNFWIPGTIIPVKKWSPHFWITAHFCPLINSYMQSPLIDLLLMGFKWR